MTLFSTFNVASQVFCRSALSFGIVNLKPLIPGHVLICPNRVVPRLQDLGADEVTDLFLLVQRVGKGLERAFGAQGLTVSCQDGPVAGQSVPHVHIHLIPRKRTDFPPGESDAIYPLLESSERALRGNLIASSSGQTHGGLLVVPKDEDRMPRSEEEMTREAQWLRTFFTSG
ncbi:hypothetical protein NliqN6_5433 [Naganishia liquefaciens]|uniref:Bis(5'-adenosyl)-triphosphatase n=1 Tax=Naganishia liquefaciens TaxID=104408 RepID=A0A8H3TY32_9TREE|nr:hypothetical protein NliqN6_5433 [Naganishia liquefaciens]